MLNILLQTLFLLSFLASHSLTKTIYIDESSPNSTSQGTLQDPYTSLADGIKNLDVSENVEILLLGDSITINSSLIFNGNITFTIKPEERPEMGYFPMRFEAGADIMLIDVNVTFEGVQIVEMDMERNVNTSLFTVNRSLLCLNNSLVANIHYSNTSYRLITSLEEENQTDVSEIWFLNTLFENLTNVQNYFEQAHIKIQGCQFNNLNTQMSSFLSLYTMSSSILNFTVINTTISDSRFLREKPYVYPGFIFLFSGGLRGYFDGFTIKNCEFSNGAKVMSYSSFGAVDVTASFGIFNTVVQNVKEEEEIFSGDGISTGSGIIFDIIRGNSVNMSNVTVENLNLEYQALFRWTPQVGNLPGTQISNTSASFTNISISNSSNPNWLLSNIAEITWENITLENIFCNTTQTQFPLFSIQNSNSARFNGVYGRNIFGPVFALFQVIYQGISNVTLDNVTNSLELDINSRNVILLQRNRDILNLGLDLSTEMSTKIEDFHINGFHVTKQENNGSVDDSFTSLIITIIELGTMSIENSIWKNTVCRGFLGVSINILNVDNLTIEADSTSFVPDWRNVFELTSVNQLSITNSSFQNNPNITLINLYNISRSGQYSTLNPISLTLENVTISNNTAGSEEIDLGASSLLSILSSKESLQITIKQSQFVGNMIGNGLIRSLESEQVSINIENSTFIENYASGNGTIFSLEKSLEGTVNSLIMTGNSFVENHCEENGGVMYFSDFLGEVISMENDFVNNSAAINGGVGYFMEGNVTYSDENSLYSGNLAQELESLFYGDPGNGFSQ